MICSDQVIVDMPVQDPLPKHAPSYACCRLDFQVFCCMVQVVMKALVCKDGPYWNDEQLVVEVTQLLSLLEGKDTAVRRIKLECEQQAEAAKKKKEAAREAERDAARQAGEEIARKAEARSQARSIIYTASWFGSPGSSSTRSNTKTQQQQDNTEKEVPSSNLGGTSERNSCLCMTCPALACASKSGHTF